MRWCYQSGWRKVFGFYICFVFLWSLLFELLGQLSLMLLVLSMVPTNCKKLTYARVIIAKIIRQFYTAWKPRRLKKRGFQKMRNFDVFTVMCSVNFPLTFSLSLVKTNGPCCFRLAYLLYHKPTEHCDDVQIAAPKLDPENARSSSCSCSYRGMTFLKTNPAS